MTVFSGCLKIIKSKIGITIMYFVIFTGISIAMQLNNSKQSVTDFQSKRMDIAFVDCDKSEISGYIYDYLNTNHNVKKMKNDKSLMQETLYYSQEDMVIKIPKGFGDKALKNGGTERFIQITQEPGRLWIYLCRAADKQSFKQHEKICKCRIFSKTGIQKYNIRKEKPCKSY